MNPWPLVLETNVLTPKLFSYFMKVFSYYLEIKNRLILLFFGWLSTVLVSYIFKEILLYIITLQKINNNVYFIFTNVTEVFSAYTALIIFMGNQVLILYLCYHTIIFVTLGLYKSEYKNVIFAFKICFFLFFFSIIIFNKILFFSSWNFFLSFQNFINLKSLTLHFEAKLNEYLSFYFKFYYLCIFYFQTFLLLILFISYIQNKFKIIKQFRRFFYYIFIVLSTLLTPPDIFSQITLSCSIIFSYEVLVFCVVFKKNLIRQPVKTN